MRRAVIALAILAALVLAGCGSSSSSSSDTAATGTTVSRARIDNPTEHDITVATNFIHNVVDAAVADMHGQQDVTDQQYEADTCVANYVVGQLPASTITLISSILDSGGAPANNGIVMDQVQHFATAGYSSCNGAG
ncbi:MAG TPA: hypothetical protein VFJ14_01705 [Nocardioidaceae bacterium]|nr:hypothetical protein [Nocardioidaceae bacterium]